MPRSLTSQMTAALTSSLIRPAILVRIAFSTGTVNAWTGVGNLSWNSETWTGVGSFGGLSTVEEGTTVEARGITLTLSGIDQSLLADALQNFQFAAPVTIYLALLDRSGAVIPDPTVIWAGLVDQPVIDVGGDMATIAVACESRMQELNVSCEKRFTQDDQQIQAPGDQGFMFVNGLQEINLSWGKQPATQFNL